MIKENLDKKVRKTKGFVYSAIYPPNAKLHIQSL